MVGLAIDGVTSFSTQPLRIATIAGASISVLSVALTLWALYLRLVLNVAIPGWASIVVPIYLISGVQLLCVGIMGEYISKMYLETKRRPRAHIAAMREPRGPEASRPGEAGA